MPADWKTDRDALVREAMAFAASVRQHTPVSNLTAAADRSAVDIEQRSQTDEIYIDRERAAIKQRVANFKALQARLIREREEFATAALQHARSSGKAMRRNIV